MIKKFLSPMRLVATLLLFSILALPAAFAGEVTLEDNSLLVAFDTDSGALTRMVNKTTGWTIERRPELGVSFRLFAPLPNRRWDPVLGQKQHAVEVKKISDNQVELQWKNLVSESDGILPITFTAEVTLTNGVLTFNSTLQNDSPYTVETIDYPYFGDFNPPSRDASLIASTMKGQRLRDMQSDELYPHFANKKGYWGVFYPTKVMADSLFCLLQAPDQGLYIQIGDTKPKYHLEYTFEQHPGILSSITQLVPPEDEIPGADALWGKDNTDPNAMTPVFLVFRTCHFVFAPANSTAQLIPVSLRCYNGGMQAGKDIYKKSRANQ
jgi:hypothetical protein